MQNMYLNEICSQHVTSINLKHETLTLNFYFVLEFIWQNAMEFIHVFIQAKGLGNYNFF
jgi:hypothetical protein